MAGAKKPPPTKRCAARKGNGTICGMVQGWGTDHPGFGRCVYHGGRSPTGKKKAAIERVIQEAPAMGVPLNLDPYEALLMCVRISAGEVAYATQMVAAIETGHVVHNPVTKRVYVGYGGELKEDVTVHPDTLNLWIETRHKCMDNLAKYSKMAIDAGVAERQVALAERYGGMIAALLRNVLGDLALTDEQLRRAPEIARVRLLELETGSYDSGGTP